MVFVWQGVSVWFGLRFFIIVEKMAVFCWDGWKREQWETGKWKRQAQRNRWTLLLLCDVNTLRVFLFLFKKKSIYSGCVCCLASLDRIHTASVEIQNPSRFSFHTHTHCCFKLLTLQSTHALQESQKRGDILLYTHTKYHFSGFSAACTTLQFAASYAFMSTVNTDTL